MYKAIGKEFKVDAVFPEPTSLFSKTKLSGPFVFERMEQLKIYMEKLVELPGVTKNVHIMGLLCLSEKYDELSQKIEDKAIEQTLSDLGMGDIVYNDITDGLTAIVIRKIKDEMWEDIKASCPPSERARNAAMTMASKVLNEIVTPIVKTGIATAKEQTAGVRKTIMDKIEEMAVTAVQAKHNVLNKLNQVMSSLLTPIVHDLSAAVAGISCVLLPVILKPFAPVIQLGHQKAMLTIRRIPESELKSGSLEKDFSVVFDLMDKALKDMKDSTKETTKDLAGNFGSSVTNPLIGGLVNLVRVFVMILG